MGLKLIFCWVSTEMNVSSSEGLRVVAHRGHGGLWGGWRLDCGGLWRTWETGEVRLLIAKKKKK